MIRRENKDSYELSRKELSTLMDILEKFGDIARTTGEAVQKQVEFARRRPEYAAIVVLGQIGVTVANIALLKDATEAVSEFSLKLSAKKEAQRKGGSKK